MQEIHFKTEGTGAAAYICTVENPCGDGMEAETREAQNGIKGTSLVRQGFEKGMADGYKRMAA